MVSVGHANIDLIINSDKLPEHGSEFMELPGGSACNFAVGCSRLGLKTGFAGFTGNDSFGKRIKDTLVKEGVKSLIKYSDKQTGFVLVFTKGQFKRFLKFSGANDSLDSLDLSSFKAKHLHLATPSLSLLKQVKDFNGTVSVDPGSTLSHYSLSKLKPYLKHVDVFFPNESEAKMITGLSYRKAAESILKAGVKISIVKLGRGGSYLMTEDEFFKTKSLDYPAIDTTGAGDAFGSAFISAWLKGKSLKEACEWGIISSNICVTKIGAQNSVTLKELESIYKQRT